MPSKPQNIRGQSPFKNNRDIYLGNFNYFMDIKANKDFEAWAMSLAGCDGGNPKGRIWFCGIEWGGYEKKESFNFDIIDRPSWSEQRREEFSKYQYDVKTIKIYSVLINRDLKDYKKVAIEKRVFDLDSELFKLNLYPISFHYADDELWDEWWFEKTGLSTKSIYRAWCQLNRFPEFKKLVEQNNPKLIIATGISYKSEFIMAFAGSEKIYHPDIHKVKFLDREFQWLTINEGNTVLAITPFLGGRYGLNSDAHIKDFSDQINSICVKQFGNDWLLQ